MHQPWSQARSEGEEGSEALAAMLFAPRLAFELARRRGGVEKGRPSQPWSWRRGGSEWAAQGLWQWEAEQSGLGEMRQCLGRCRFPPDVSKLPCGPSAIPGPLDGFSRAFSPQLPPAAVCSHGSAGDSRTSAPIPSPPRQRRCICILAAML